MDLVGMLADTKRLGQRNGLRVLVLQDGELRLGACVEEARRGRVVIV